MEKLEKYRQIVQEVQELVDKGVPPSDIILGLHPPYKRPYTKYGLA
nr:element excision factor XisI family protein [Roseofilum capinflatum]